MTKLIVSRDALEGPSDYCGAHLWPSVLDLTVAGSVMVLWRCMRHFFWQAGRGSCRLRTEKIGPEKATILNFSVFHDFCIRPLGYTCAQRFTIGLFSRVWLADRCLERVWRISSACSGLVGARLARRPASGASIHSFWRADRFAAREETQL